MVNLSKHYQIAWAVDPFDNEIIPDSWAIQELLFWAESAHYKIQPIHVLSVSKLDFGPENEDSWILRYVPCAEKATLQYLHDLGVKNIEIPKILVEHSSTTRGAVQKLVQYAEHTESQMIAISTCGKSGLGQLLFGGFAESLLAQSHLPILFLTHQKQVAEKRLNRVLFPTDFSESSRKTFFMFIAQAEGFLAEIVLFSDVTLPVQAAAFGQVAGIPLVPEDFMKKQRQWAERQAHQWIKHASEKGIKARIVLKEGISNISESVLNTAEEEQVGLIAMSSHNGPIAAVMIGSIAREVFHSNRFPVWVCGPHVDLDKIESVSPPSEDSEPLEIKDNFRGS